LDNAKYILSLMSAFI